MFLDHNKLGSSGLEAQENRWILSTTTITQHIFQQKTHKTLGIPEVINIDLLWLIEKIPYHAWWWALNRTRSDILTAIPDTNYSTLVAICQKFLSLGGNYWNDNRDRNFLGIIEAIELRLSILWYTVIETEVRHYLNDSNMKRLHIPTEIQKL